MSVYRPQTIDHRLETTDYRLQGPRNRATIGGRLVSYRRYVRRGGSGGSRSYNVGDMSDAVAVAVPGARVGEAYPIQGRRQEPGWGRRD